MTTTTNKERNNSTRFPTPAECYFQRAVAFNRNDDNVWLLFGIYLHKLKHYEPALKQYMAAEKLNPDSSNVHYNLGLLLVDMKRYDQAREHAKKAYALGHQLPGLRKRLQTLGRW